MSEAGIARYNAEGTLKYPPIPQSAAQVHAFWTQVYVPDHEVDEDELERGETRAVYYRSHNDQHGDYLAPEGAYARTAFRVTRMLRDAQKLPADEARALRALPIEVAPDQYTTVDELDHRWGISLLDMLNDGSKHWLTRDLRMDVFAGMREDKEKRARENAPAGPSYEEIVATERRRQLAREHLRDERDLGAYGGEY